MHFSYTILLIIVTVGVSLYAYEKRDLFEKLAYKPYLVATGPKEYYRLLSHAFVHADLIHLLFNMMVLYYCGETLEKYFALYYGKKGLYYFVLLYFGGALFSCLPSQAKYRNEPFYSSIGASGATSALLFAIIALAPTAGNISFFFIPVPMPPIVFGVIYLALEYYLSKRGGTNIAHDAHIYGALFGLGFIFLIDSDNFYNFIDQVKHWRR